MLIATIVKILTTAMSCLKSLLRLEVEVAKLRVGQERIDGSLQFLSGQMALQGEVLTRILAAVEPLPAVGFVFTVELEGQTEEGATRIEMTNSQQATATIQPVDVKGNPASIDTSAGGPVWASSDETIVTVEAAADGLSAVVRAAGPLGTAKVSVTGDADLGPDHKGIFGEIDVTITQGQAVGLKITLGDATEQ